jgi:hypothetical protein
MKRYGPPEQSDFTFVPHSKENPHNHPPNIETAEVIDIRNEAKNEGLVNKTSEENMRGKVASTSRQLKLIYYYFFF